MRGYLQNDEKEGKVLPYSTPLHNSNLSPFRNSLRRQTLSNSDAQHYFSAPRDGRIELFNHLPDLILRQAYISLVSLFKTRRLLNQGDEPEALAEYIRSHICNTLDSFIRVHQYHNVHYTVLDRVPGQDNIKCYRLYSRGSFPGDTGLYIFSPSDVRNERFEGSVISEKELRLRMWNKY